MRTLSTFVQTRRDAIRQEIIQLLAPGFKKEVYHPKWLANPMLLRKKNKS